MILVAVDFSPPSAAALLWGARTAQAFGDQLTILHVVHDPEAAPGYYRAKKHGKHVRRLENAASDMLNEFVDGLVEANPELTILPEADRLLVVGIPVSRILEVAETTEARLLVVGSNGRTGLSHFMLGSKAERVAQLAPIPVTIVKAPLATGPKT